MVFFADDKDPTPILALNEDTLNQEEFDADTETETEGEGTFDDSGPDPELTRSFIDNLSQLQKKLLSTLEKHDHKHKNYQKALEAVADMAFVCS